VINPGLATSHRLVIISADTGFWTARIWSAICCPALSTRCHGFASSRLWLPG